ncbi:MAG TPA: 50S ribosomal protein L6 [Candidatus Peregrinibacteria bacterium]|nr:50S ribosomal protein L6 [Candidatus Peregrinibacteria bacterium]
MSKVGKKPVKIPAGVELKLDKKTVSAKGPKGELKWEIPGSIDLVIEGDEAQVKPQDEEKSTKISFGLTRAMVNNMVIGVSEGFEKRLEIRGVGYKANVSGSSLNLNLGFSHPIEFKIPEGIEIGIDKENKNLLIINGIDKQRVGEAAAQIRSYRKPEPYKGKGIRYEGEYVPIKQGKTVAKE